MCKNREGKIIKTKNLKVLFCAACFFSYIMRQNYNAVLTEIINETGVSSKVASIGVMGSFIAYGVFQIISGLSGDKFKPERIIFTGLIGSSLINLAVWTYPNIYFMNVLWCINGAFQSLIWPPLVRLIVDCLESSEYSSTVVRASQSSYAATVFIYVAVPFVISAMHWKYVFAFSGVVGGLFSIFWFIKTKRIRELKNVERRLKTSEKSEKSKTKMEIRFLLSVGLVPIIISTFVAGFLRDGISVWMPKYINDVYNLGSSSSILTGAVIPISCALLLGVFKKAGEKIGNELKAVAIFYSIALVSCVSLFFCFSFFSAFDVILMASITACVHGVNLMLVCNVPEKFARYGQTSTMSGIFNAAVYAGSALSAFGIAALEKTVGWKNVCASWAALILIAMLLCFFWRKRYKKLDL